MSNKNETKNETEVIVNDFDSPLEINGESIILSYYLNMDSETYNKEVLDSFFSNANCGYKIDFDSLKFKYWHKAKEDIKGSNKKTVLDINDALVLLKTLKQMLDCTNPPKDLADEIFFDSSIHSDVTPYITCDGGDGFCFVFEKRIVYEEGERWFLYPDNPLLIKYFYKKK